MTHQQISELTQLRDAITHATEIAERESCTMCGEEHRQLVVWLTELHELKTATYNQK